MAYGITSESQLIDITTINAGCDQIDKAAEDFTKCGKQVNIAADICNADALSVDGKTMASGIGEMGDSITALEGNITGFTSEIRALASQILTAQTSELNEYIAEQKRLQESNNKG